MLFVRTALGAALALGPFLMISAPANAADPISYTCDTVTLTETEPFVGAGRGNCAPSNGAPTIGFIETEFLVKQKDGSTTLTCESSTDSELPAGSVYIPAGVVGNSCEADETETTSESTE